MKNHLLFCLVSFLFFIPASSALSAGECFDFYKFGNAVEFNGFITERGEYSPGDEVFALYKLKDITPAPIVEGKIFAYVFYNDPVLGEQIIDEFYITKGVNLLVGDELEQSFRWRIPAQAREGKYTIKTYFIVGDYFNLAGLSILPYGPPGVPGAQVSFNVKPSGSASSIYYRKEDTSINGVKWDFGAPSKVFGGEPIVIKSKLVNVGGEKNVDISLEVYDWADVAGKPIAQYSVKKTVKLVKEEPISYELKNLPVGVYEVVFTALSGEEKSILKLRIPVMGEKARLIYTGLMDFPLEKGEQTAFFTCFSQSADYGSAFNGTLIVEVLDAKGNKVFTDTSNSTWIHSTPPQALITMFTAPENMNYLAVRASIYDAAGNLHDTASLVYDYSKFPNLKSELKVELSTKEIMSGDILTYTVSALDAAGNPMTDEVHLYVMDSTGKVVNMLSNKKVEGVLTGSMQVSGAAGEYRFIASETKSAGKAEAAFVLNAKTTTTTAKIIEAATTQPKEQTTPTNPGRINPSDIYPYAVIGLIIILVVYFLAGRKKK